MFVAVAAVLAAACGGTSGTTGSGTPAKDLADNGVAELSAADILGKTKTALTGATTVRISGTGFAEGGQIEMDFRFKGTEGGAGWGTFDGQRVEMIRVGQTVYFKADEAFWSDMTGDADAAREIAGKYLKTGAADEPALKLLATFTDLSAFSSMFLTPDGGSYTKGERKQIRGIDAIGLVESGPRGLTLYVAAQGPAYPLQLVATKADDNGTLDFVDYGAPVQLDEPPADQVVDLDEVTSG